MAITRRQFMKRTGLATAGLYLGPSLFGSRLVRRAMASSIGGRYLIVFFLDGGNDGLNTVVPVSNGTTGTLRTAYENARQLSGNGGLQLTPGDLGATALANDWATGTPLALHPGFRGFQGYNGVTAGDGGFKALFDAGELAVIQGCGYPDPSLSHDQARTIWRTANPLGLAPYGTGWVSRLFAADGYTGADIPAVAIESGVPADFSASPTSVLAVESLDDFSFPYDGDYGGDDAAKRAAFSQLYQLAQAPTGQQPALRSIGSSGASTLVAAESYPPLHEDYVTDRATYDARYDEVSRSSANDLREIAKIIYGVERSVPNIGARYFELSNGGYDTHSDQGAAAPDGQHFQLHAEVSAAIKVFRDDLVDMGSALHGDPSAIWGRTTILVWSEFSRRIPQNDNGTDHGSQGPLFVIGGHLNGGLYGHHPNINASALNDDGNTAYHRTGDGFDSTDLRDVYGTVLKHWVGLAPATVSALLPVDGGDPTLYWTSPNFDLARPSDGQPLFKP